MVTHKVCPQCPEKGAQPREAFLVRKRNLKQSLYSWCRACTKVYKDQYNKTYHGYNKVAKDERRAKEARARQLRIDAQAYAKPVEVEYFAGLPVPVTKR